MEYLVAFMLFSLFAGAGGEDMAIAEINLEDYEVATFSGGCFWCSEAAFEAEDGVVEAISGYAGGDEEDANYAKVSSGKTKHREGVQVYYDPDKINYERLVEVYWRHIDPTQGDGQFADKGFHYTTAIFYHNDSQKMIAEKSKADLDASEKFTRPITTKVLPFVSFYPAEEHHQDYYKKRSGHYNLYAAGSGRKGFIEDNWKDDMDKEKMIEEEEEEYSGEDDLSWDDPNFEMPSEEELRETLTDLQYNVIRKDGTERAFTPGNNHDNKEEGIYVDVVSGAPLYSSTDKFDSGTGWPSFTKAIHDDEITYKKDFKLLIPRTEVRSADSDSHLGHVFNDGPVDRGGKRHCINGAALRFVPKADLEKEGYGKYLSLFE